MSWVLFVSFLVNLCDCTVNFFFLVTWSLTIASCVHYYSLILVIPFLFIISLLVYLSKWLGFYHFKHFLVFDLVFIIRVFFLIGAAHGFVVIRFLFILWIGGPKDLGWWPCEGKSISISLKNQVFFYVVLRESPWFLRYWNTQLTR